MLTERKANNEKKKKNAPFRSRQGSSVWKVRERTVSDKVFVESEGKSPKKIISDDWSRKVREFFEQGVISLI